MPSKTTANWLKMLFSHWLFSLKNWRFSKNSGKGLSISLTEEVVRR